ncbi:hypothetical protein B0J11DRAFT_446629 [Dendryphion nanum]|uniref:Uncharacterized protein n=1 Tax=Dendryphion nanum TaxID=256645 RepID=A0A9P9D5N8_9PLEO|nr:hypothetical protein B0J11DRAFT_446629 [Dendryphion nanum]
MTSSTIVKSKSKKANTPIPKIDAVDVMFAVTRQIDQSHILNEAFYSNFLHYFTSDGEARDLQNRTTWLHQLPAMAVDGTDDCLALSLRATAAAYCATETCNISLFQTACNLYGQALRKHARSLNTRKKEVTAHTISTSVMLSLFEAMRATTRDAYRSHIQGAAKMFEETGPGYCMSGVLCQLFFHVRTQLAFVYLTLEEGEPIPVLKILTENLAYLKTKLPMFQRLMSRIATLAELYVKYSKTGHAEEVIELQVYTNIKTEIEALWTEYRDQGYSRNEELFFTENCNTAYRDPFTALTIAYFSSARILFALLAPRLAASYTDPNDHYAIILSCSTFLRARRIGCAYIRMATPLYLVALHGPKEHQRLEAMSVFQEWSTGSMAGVSTIALETIEKRQKKPLVIPPLAPLEPANGVEWADTYPLSMYEFEDWIAQM